MMAMIPAGT